MSVAIQISECGTIGVAVRRLEGSPTTTAVALSVESVMETQRDVKLKRLR